MANSGLPWPVSPHLHRWMMFVDGENLAIRAKEYAKAENFELVEGRFYRPDVFVWLPGIGARRSLDSTDKETPTELRPQAVRSFYYTTVTDDGVRLKEIREALHNLHFHPEVFKKAAKDRKTKAVDISLATDMLWHVFR